MFALPLSSIAVETAVASATMGPVLIAKWFAFWSVGWRLSLAGLRQILQPAFTAKEVLGLKTDEALPVVRELGFANAALGVIGILSLLLPPWQLAVALAGGIFYLLAGVTHALQARRNRLENVAMASDLFVGAVLLVACAGWLADR